MGRSEKETRLELIDPWLAAADWTDALTEREYPYKKGRIRLIGEQTVRDEPQFVDYLLREEPRGLILAVVEAKDEDHGPGAGLQQALAYAVDLDVSFAYSSNGHRIVEHDRLTNKVTNLKAFPTPTELLDRLRAGRQMRGPTVTNSHGAEVPNPLIAPAYAVPGGGGLRYYQKRAVTAAIEQMLLGRHSCASCRSEYRASPPACNPSLHDAIARTTHTRQKTGLGVTRVEGTLVGVGVAALPG